MAIAHKFKACPFCGIETGFAFGDNADLAKRKYWVVCEVGCLSEGPVGGSEKAAVEAWNTRAPVVVAA